MFQPLLVAVALMCPPAEPEVVLAPAAAPDSGKLSGRWTRDAGPVRLTLAFADGRLTGTGFYQDEIDEAESLRVTIDADYSVSPDNVVYGVITAVDASPGCAATMLQSLAGQPFAFRCRPGDTVLSISDAKFMGYSSGTLPSTAVLESMAPTSNPTNDLLAKLNGYVLNSVMMFAGRYTPDDGKAKPTAKAKAKKPKSDGVVAGAAIGAATGTAIGGLVGAQTGGNRSGPLAGALIQTVGPAVLPPASAGPPSFVPLAPSTAYSAPLPPPTSPPPYGAPVSPPFQVPTVSFTAPANTSPILTPTPIQQPTSLVAVAPTTNKFVGKWYKDKPGIRFTVKASEQRLKLTIEQAVQEGSKLVRATVRVDADYAVSPDGLHFGVVTGVDFDLPDGDAKQAQDLESAQASVNQLQGAMFKFRVRSDDGELSVRDFVVAGVSGLDNENSKTMVQLLSGRYQALGDKPLPELKPMFAK